MTSLPSQRPDAAHPGTLWTPYFMTSANPKRPHPPTSSSGSLHPALVHPFDTDKPDPLNTVLKAHRSPSGSTASFNSHQDTLLQASLLEIELSSNISSGTQSDGESMTTIASLTDDFSTCHIKKGSRYPSDKVKFHLHNPKLFPSEAPWIKRTQPQQQVFYPQAQLVPLHGPQPSPENYRLKVRASNIEGKGLIERVPMKKLFGNGGMLEDFSGNSQASKLGKSMKALKHKASHLFGDMSQAMSTLPSNTHTRGQVNRQHGSKTYSDPKAQAKLVAQIEVLVQSEAARFIEYEFSSGRISLQSVSTIEELWRQKHRPEVHGFAYDIETQLRLCDRNASTIRWTGGKATSKTGVRDLLVTWKKLNDDLRLRTYGLSDYYLRNIILMAGSVVESLDPSVAGTLELQSIKENHSALTLARGAGQHD